MSTLARTLLAVALALCLLPLQSARAADGAGAKKKIYLLAGGPSHGFGAHDHLSGCHLLAKRLNESNLGIEAEVIQGFPKEKGKLDDAVAVIMYCDGGGGHLGIPHMKKLDEHISNLSSINSGIKLPD